MAICRYILVRKMFNKVEVDKMRLSVERSEAVKDNIFFRNDKNGSRKWCVWNRAADDILGVAAR